ncbi:MAG: glycosyltransferase family 39 protein [Sphingobacteriales bacterium]|nr:MAG: glycosyltransferase family 39 protein [Sphingobacteriales bacterium]
MLKKNVLLLFFIILKFVIQYQLVHPVYQLHRDEFLHLDQSKHLAAGYLSVPPFTSWIAWIINWLGNSEFWIRFFPALFGALTLVVVWKAMEELRAGIFALVLGAVAVVFSVLLRLNILFQPNSFDVLAWTFVYFCLLKYCNTDKNKWLCLAAVGFAIGFLNKYNIAFQLLGLLPALLLTEQRSIFFKPAFWGSLLLAFIIVAPNLYWQYRHGFPVLHHMQELTNTQLVNVSRLKFLQEQLLFFMGSFFVLMAGFFSIVLHRPFKKYLILLYGFLFTMLLFLYFQAKAYYAIGLYPVFLAFGAVWLESWTKAGWRKYVFRPLLIMFPLLLFIPMIELAFPVKSPEQIVADNNKQKKLGLHRWEDGKEHPISQDFADMQGWKELAAIVDSVYALIPDKEHTLVRCDNYGQTGAINYYSKFPGINALSYNADYVYWFPKNVQWKNMIMVKDADESDPERKDERPYFDSIFVAGKITNEFAREKGTTVYVLLNATPEVTTIIQKEVSDRQKY